MGCDTLLERQLRLFGDIARKGNDDPLREAVFEEGTVLVRKTEGARKRGRPRQKWADIVHAHAVDAAGGAEALQDKLADQVKWRTAVKHYIERRRRQ